jgi:hypothetical protein
MAYHQWLQEEPLKGEENFVYKPTLIRPESLKVTVPSVFDVSLHMYAFQPWIKSNNYSQWFNYGFNPSTFSAYAQQQVAWLRKQQNDSNIVQGQSKS